jgi:hypothetical protein
MWTFPILDGYRIPFFKTVKKGTPSPVLLVDARAELTRVYVRAAAPIRIKRTSSDGTSTDLWHGIPDLHGHDIDLNWSCMRGDLLTIEGVSGKVDVMATFVLERRTAV